MNSQATPEVVHGGCLCAKIRYEIKFPPNHDFSTACSTCQCEQCRKNTGYLLFEAHKIKLSSLTWLAQSSLKNYRASPEIDRGFCDECGSFLYWLDHSKPGETNLAVGSIDQVDLRRYGPALTLARRHVWCAEEIEGVTDHLKGTRWRFNDEGDAAELMPDSE